MSNFDNLAAAAKLSQIENSKAAKSGVSYGAAIDGRFQIVVSPVEGRISYLRTIKMTCYINGKRVSKAAMQEAMQ